METEEERRLRGLINVFCFFENISEFTEIGLEIPRSRKIKGLGKSREKSVS